MGALCAASPGAASAVTWSVSPNGSDANLGTAQFPFRTVSRAAGVARAGDTVLVASGRYLETVSLSSRNSGVEFRGVGNGRPVIDGARRRAYGFRNAGAKRLTIAGFEISGQTVAGVYTQGSHNTVAGNVIHHVGSSGETQSNGVRVVRGSANTVSGNTIHHIGPGLSSIGIWLVETRDARVEGNSVYLVRKEGVRDWKGLDNAVVGNSSFLNWVGISLNTSTGSSVTDNHVFDNVEGFAVKHTSYRTVLDYWDLDAAHWSRLQHNTVERSSETGIWIAQSDEPLDYLDVRGNRFSGAGAAFIRDIPSLRGPNVSVDTNAYSDAGGDPRWLYKAGWGSGGGLTDWAAVRQETGWETTAPAVDAGTRTALAATASWTQFAMTPVDSSSKGTYYTRNHLGATADGDQSTYWLTEGNRDEYVVFDFGQPRTFNHLILTLYGDGDKRKPRGYRFSVSGDRATWQGIKSGVNQDASQAARFYELREPVTARYLRFTMVDTFCDSYLPRLGCARNFVLSDLKAGMLGPPGPAAAEEPSAPPPEIGVASEAVLTDKGRLRIRVTCVGSSAGRARFVVRHAGHKRVALRRGCSRSVEIPLKRRFVRRLRRGKLSALRLMATAPSGSRLTTRVRVRT
jgi:hypothetical protein